MNTDRAVVLINIIPLSLYTYIYVSYLCRLLYVHGSTCAYVSMFANHIYSKCMPKVNIRRKLIHGPLDLVALEPQSLPTVTALNTRHPYVAASVRCLPGYDAAVWPKVCVDNISGPQPRKNTCNISLLTGPCYQIQLHMYFDRGLHVD